MSAIQRLASDEPLLRDGVRVVVDVALRRPVSEYVDLAVLTDVVAIGLDEAFISRVVREHLMPARTRVRDGLQGNSVGTLLPDAVQPALEELVATMPLPRFQWLAGAVEPQLVRELFSPIWQEIFGGFAKNMNFGAIGDSLGGVGKSLAGALSSLGSSVSKGVARATDGRVQGAIKDFSDGVTGQVKSALIARIQSDEGQAITEKIRRQVHARILETDVATIVDDLERLPLDSLLALAPQVIADNARSELGRRLVRAELAAALAIEGERLVEDLLNEAQTLPVVRAYLRTTGEALLRELLVDDDFKAWIERWLGEAK